MKPFLMVVVVLLIALFWSVPHIIKQLRVARMPAGARARRDMLLRANYGRDAGWYVEREGRRVAELDCTRREEMFWDSYRIVPICEDINEQRQMLVDKLYWLNADVEFRSRAADEVAECAFIASDVFTEDGRLLVRALYFPLLAPTWWEEWTRRFSA